MTRVEMFLIGNKMIEKIYIIPFYYKLKIYEFKKFKRDITTNFYLKTNRNLFLAPRSFVSYNLTKLN